MNETLVLPWGLTTIEDDAFVIAGYRPTVIIPDTVTSMQQNHAGGKDCSVIFTYSKSNTAVANVIGGKTDYFDRPISNPVDSLAEYYPDHVKPSEPEPTTPSSEPSSQPTESKPEPSKPAESSKPAEPSSKPADTSKPAQTASKPASQPQAESSAEQEKPSSVASESSAAAELPLPAESSLLEESILESSISESSPESSDELYEEMSREETPERTSGGVNWVIPLVFALGAMAAVAAVVLFIIWKKK